ncbi:hypothetical protein SDC9_137608 [bioreactor metagenome]|uniref:Uncharacterized protein n=1 Tax=bioreactor metagenome TaxID=1076179 RepID=A0A645DMF9_9ZZZZ
MAEYRSSGYDVHEVFLRGLQNPYGFLLVGIPRSFQVQVLVYEFPALDPEALHVLLKFRSLLAHSFCHDKAGAAANSVGLDPGKVPETRDLHPLCALSVNAYGAFPDYDPDLLRRRRILNMLALFVERYLLYESVNLLPGGLVLSYAEFLSDHVRYEDAHGLAGASRCPYRPCEHQIDVLAAVRVALHLRIGEPFQGGDEDPLRKDGKTCPYGPVYSLLPGLRRLFGHSFGYHE